MEIVHKNGESDGIFLAQDNGKIVGEMTYIWSGDNNFVINHTAVSGPYQDRGIGLKMVATAVQYARDNNLTITPVCSFARGVFNSTPEYNDIRKQ